MSTEQASTPKKTRVFKKATDISYRWTEDAVCFDCPCGNKEIIVSEEEERCDCGRVYRVVHYVEVSGDEVLRRD